jgi:hypothetical protein
LLNTHWHHAAITRWMRVLERDEQALAPPLNASVRLNPLGHVRSQDNRRCQAGHE